MKKRLLMMLIVIFIFPYSVFASEKISIECNNNILYNNEECECEIKVKDLNYTVTSISGKILVSDNLMITESFYDEENWLMLDKEFRVNDINLISENLEKKENFTIAKFRVKAINKKNANGTIEFKNVVFGDDAYEENEEMANNISLELKYDANEEFKIMIILMILVVIIILTIYFKKDKNKGGLL